MAFNSFYFVILLSAAFLIYWAIPGKFRWIVLLAANSIFYMSCGVKAMLILTAEVAVSYFLAIALEDEKNACRKKRLCTFGIIICAATLAFFKYLGFFEETVGNLFALFSVSLQPTTIRIIAPLGISFYTFRTISYLVDVTRGKIRAERHPGIYAVYVSFFPIITSGPIERGGDLIPQLKKEHIFDYNLVSYGAKLILWGAFKKYVIADTLAEYADKILSDVYLYQGSALLYASLFFTIQIYCDFSGYTDIACGVARLFGIRLTENFKSPYFSESLKEFWSRWHISLSSWLRDYIYIPLGGSRVSKIRGCINLMVTFLFSGLWHGASWTFVIWGGIHGAGQIVEKLMGIRQCRNRNSVLRWLKTAVVFIFVSFAWVFFRMGDVRQAFYVIGNMFRGISSPVSYFSAGKWAMELRLYKILLIAFFVAILAAFDRFSLETDVIEWVSGQRKIIRYSIYFALALFVVLFRSVGNVSFIYANF